MTGALRVNASICASDTARKNTATNGRVSGRSHASTAQIATSFTIDSRNTKLRRRAVASIVSARRRTVATATSGLFLLSLPERFHVARILTCHRMSVEKSRGQNFLILWTLVATLTADRPVTSAISSASRSSRIEKHDLPIQRFQLVNDRQQTRRGPCSIELILAIARLRP